MNKGSDEMAMIGVDVSKHKLDCFWLKDPHTGKGRSKVVANSAAGCQALVQWATGHSGQEAGELMFVMEATGGYHDHAALSLYEQGAQVSVVNPAQVREFANSFGRRSKTDTKDSQVLARYGASRELVRWEPEPLAVRELKALIRRLEAIDKDIQREHNRLEKTQNTSGMQEVKRSIEHVVKQLQTERKRVAELIDQHIDGHPELKRDRALLESIPGVAEAISRGMLAVMHTRRFRSAAQCAAYLGLVPLHNESGAQAKPARLSKTGPARIRAQLYMAAISATQHNPDIRRQYRRLIRAGKSKLAALVAAMRKLVQICFGVLKHQMPYQPQTLTQGV